MGNIISCGGNEYNIYKHVYNDYIYKDSPMWKENGIVWCSISNNKFFYWNEDEPHIQENIKQMSEIKFKGIIIDYFRERSLLEEYSTNSFANIMLSLAKENNMQKCNVF